MYKNIEKILFDKGLTPYRMCKDLNIPTSNITGWRRGDCNPSLKNLKKIANYLEVSIEDLLRGE